MPTGKGTYGKKVGRPPKNGTNQNTSRRTRRTRRRGR